MQNCFFTPEINGDDVLKKTKIKTKTINLLEDPESYSLYIKRLQKKRDEVERDKIREKERPGSGNIWERRLRNRRNNSNSYDYTKHEYSRNLSRSKSGKKTPINNLNYSLNSNKILKTEDSGRKITKKIKKGVDKNIIYEEIYKKNVYKMDDPYGSGMGGDEKNKNENIPKDNNNNNKNENNRYQKNTYTFSDFISHENLMKSQENKKMDTIIPYEEKMQLKILQRSIAQEKAFNHLRRILSPEKEYLNESNYQGFNNNNSESDFDKKRKELEIADKARKIQVEKMKKLLDESILEREKRKMAEKEFDKKYREMNEREYESYRERETKKKMVKNQKMQNYRKMLDEQIEQKKKFLQ